MTDTVPGEERCWQQATCGGSTADPAALPPHQPHLHHRSLASYHVPISLSRLLCHQALNRFPPSAGHLASYFPSTTGIFSNANSARLHSVSPSPQVVSISVPLLRALRSLVPSPPSTSICILSGPVTSLFSRWHCQPLPRPQPFLR